MTAIEITPRSSKTSAWPPTAQMSFLLSIANCGSFFIPELFSIIPSVKKKLKFGNYPDYPAWIR